MRFRHAIDPDSFIVRDISHVTEAYWLSAERNEYLELIMFNYKIELQPRQLEDHQFYIYLIPLNRAHKITTHDKQGYLIAFKRAYLEEDDKEYSLDVFKLFNNEGQYTTMVLDNDVAARLNKIKLLMEEELHLALGTYLVIKALLKAYLLNLIRVHQNAFLEQDVNQKRVYQFIMLLNEYYQKERKASFYAGKLGISEKRLNQILIEKTQSTVTRQLHKRLVLEAKRMLLSGELTIKEIAYQLNFEDRAYFTRFFKKQTGLTPEIFKQSSSL